MHKMSQERHDRVVWLLYKCIIGALSSEEHEELEQWRKEDPSHERTYQRLTHVRFLEQEFRRLKLVDAERPMQDMRARIRATPLLRAVRWFGGLQSGPLPPWWLSCVA